MKHRISLLSTTGIGVTLLWLATVSLAGAAQAFDIDDGETVVAGQNSSRMVRGRMSLKPTPTQSSRKGLVFPRVYEDSDDAAVPSIAFAPLGAATTVQAASNTMTVATVVPPAPLPASVPYATLAPSPYAAPAQIPASNVEPDMYAAMAPAASASVAPATYAPAPVAYHPPVTTPVSVQTSTRIFDPLALTPPTDAAGCQCVAPIAYPSAAPVPVAAAGAPEPLATLPLASTGPKGRSAQYAKNPTQVIRPPEVVPEQLAALPQPKPEQLSRKTKAVLGTIPSKMDAAKIEKTEKFDLSRMAAGVDALDLKKAGKVDAYESAGIKISVRRPGLDTNYELNRAYNALTSGDTAAAMQTYKEVLSVEPTNQDALFGLASLYHRQGDIAHARPLYAVLLKNYPTHREGINNFLVLVSDESPQEALAELERLEQRNPDFSPIPAQEALVLERLGYSSEAQVKMTRAIELAPENLTYKYNLAVMMDRQRNYPQAIALYRLLLDSSSKGAALPASSDSIQRRLNHLATVVNSGNIPTVGRPQTL